MRSELEKVRGEASKESAEERADMALRLEEYEAMIKEQVESQFVSNNSLKQVLLHRSACFSVVRRCIAG